MAADNEKRQRHWTRTRNLTFVILFLWFIFSLVIPYYTKALNAFSFLGFPLGAYMIAQGSLIAFVLMIIVHNWMQDKIDDEAGFHED